MISFDIFLVKRYHCVIPSNEVVRNPFDFLLHLANIVQSNAYGDSSLCWVLHLNERVS